MNDNTTNHPLRTAIAKSSARHTYWSPLNDVSDEANRIVSASLDREQIAGCSPWRLSKRFEDGKDTLDFLYKQGFRLVGETSTVYIMTPPAGENGVTEWVRDSGGVFSLIIRRGWEAMFSMHYFSEKSTYLYDVKAAQS